jgi:hypothetical protein
MEIFENITGVTQKKGLRVEKPIQSLAFKTDATTLNAEIEAYVETNKGENFTIMPKSSIKYLMEMAAAKEGHILMNPGFEGSIDLSDTAAFDLQNDEVIVINITGLGSSQTYSLYGIEVPIKDRKLNQYTTKKIVNGDTTKYLDVREFEQIFVSNLSKIESVEITFLSGYTAKYTANELKAIMRSVNDVLYLGEDGSGNIILEGGAQGDNLIFPLNEAATIYIEVVGDTTQDIVLKSELDA